MPIPELLDDESSISIWSSARVVAELFANHRQGRARVFYLRASELMSLPVLGVSGWLKSSCVLDVLGKSGHMDASSSAMKVDCEGDVVNDSGNCRNEGSDETPKLFIFFTARQEKSIRSEPKKSKIFSLFSSRFSVSRRSHSKHFSIDIN